MSNGGLLDFLNDPEKMAEIEAHNQLVGKLARQMGVTRDEARQALWNFDAIMSSEGQTLH